MPVKSKLGIILLAHGSRDPQWARPFFLIAERIRVQAPQVVVACAYLELCVPDLASAVQALIANGVELIRVVPLFLGTGKHIREDLPRQIAQLQRIYPAQAFALQAPVGEHPKMLALMAELAIAPDLNLTDLVQTV